MTSASTPNESSTRLRDLVERAAGYHPPAPTGTRILVFGCCAAGAHARCPGTVTVGGTRYVCRCCSGHGLPAPTAYELEA